jgi:hypothetical protein
MHLNDYLLCFLKQHYGSWKEWQVLGDDQLRDIINLAKKSEWTLKLMEGNVDLYNLNLNHILIYLERLGLVDELLKKAQQEKQRTQKHQGTKKRTIMQLVRS